MPELALPPIERQDWLNLESRQALRKTTFRQSWVTLVGLQVQIMHTDRRKRLFAGELTAYEEYTLNDSEQAYTTGFALTLDSSKSPIRLLADTQAAQVRWIRALHAALSVNVLVRVGSGVRGRALASTTHCPCDG